MRSWVEILRVARPGILRSRTTQAGVGIVAAVVVLGLVVSAGADLRRSPSSTSFDRSGDGRADLVTWDPDDGAWQLGDDRITLGGAGAIGVAADWDGDGRIDAGVWRPETGQWEMTGRGPRSVGLPGDLPVPCAWRSQGWVEPAVWRPATGAWHDADGLIGHLGGHGDVPVPEDWTADGTCDPALFSAADGRWPGTGPHEPFGRPGDVPVPGDWTGDGTVDRALWRPATGAWIVDRPDGPATVAHLGLPTDQPVPADWVGDGRLEPAVWRSDDATLRLVGDQVRHAGLEGREALILAPAARLARGAEAAASGGVDDPTTGVHGARNDHEVHGGQPTERLTVVGLRLPGATGVLMLVLLAASGWRRPGWPGRAGELSNRFYQPTLPERLLLLAAVALPLGAWRVGPVTAGDVLLLGVVAAALCQQGPTALRASLRRLPPPVQVGGALALAGGLLGGLAGTAGPVGADELARATAGVALPLLAVAVVGPDHVGRRRLALAFAVGAAFSVLAGLGSVVTGSRLTGLATHPNHLGLACLLGVALAAAARTGRPGGRRVQVLPWALIAVNASGVALSGSRSALLGMVALAVGGLLTRRHRLSARRLVPIIAVAAPTAAVIMLHATTIERLVGDPASDAGRRFRLELALERISRSPLTGEGFRFLEEAHSVPLQLWVAGGPLTFVGGGLLLLTPLLAGLHRTAASQLHRWLALGWLAYLAGGLAQNITIDRYVWFVAALLIAQGTASAACHRAREQPTALERALPDETRTAVIATPAR